MSTRGSRVAASLAVSVGLLAGSPVPGAEATFPDSNGRIAFSQAPIVAPIGAEPGELGAHSQIFTIKSSGGKVRRLTSLAAKWSASSPDWSPDGSKIAYQSNKGGLFHIWVMNADGSDQHRVTSDTAFEDFHPSWSPDGSQLLFSHCPEPLGFPASCEVAVMDEDGNNLDSLLSAGDWYNVHAVFSPDGSQIAFGSDMDGHQSAVWVMESDGDNPEQVTDTSLRAFWPDWSPDGSRILFTDHCCIPRSNLWTVEPDGDNLDQLTDTPPGGNIDFGSYSPDGEQIVTHNYQHCSAEGICSHFYTFDSDGQNPQRVKTGKRDTFLTDWGPGN